MQQRRKIIGNSFLSIAILGALFLLVELIFQSFGRSICQTEGCRVVSQHTRFGDISIILIGLSTCALLAFFSFLTLYRNRTGFEKYINLILVVSLAAEGYFAGYQAFSIHAACFICLITLGIFLTLGMLRLLYGETNVLAGFLSFAAVLAFFYLVLPAERTVTFPEDELILFYSKECKYCAELMKEIDANNIRITHVLVGEYSGFLKQIGIEHVPTLYVNRRNQKIFLTGKEAISQYLFADKPKPAAAAVPGLVDKPKPAVKTVPGLIEPNRWEPYSLEPNRLPILNDTLLNTLNQSDDKGMCKETEKCD